MKVSKVLDTKYGGFGKVEKVELESGEIVARKIFAPQVPMARPELAKALERFRREVKHQSGFKRQALMPVLDSDLTADPPWFLMPWAERSYLEQVAEERASGKVTVEPLADILSGLEVLHTLGYTHRDLKPANVLFHDGKWKLADFGLILPPTGSTTKLTTQSAWGSTPYCAPEQAQSFGTVTPAADIYAFGCILHDLFTDGIRVPYARQTGPGKIGWVIQTCTETDPKKRFKSVAKLRGVLLGAFASPPPPATAQATEWINELPEVERWSAEKLAEFQRYAQENLPHAGSVEPLPVALDEDILKHLVGRDPAIGEAIAIAYCDWIRGSGFGFSYCDVLVGRLQAVFAAAGTLGAKSAAALAAANLGNTHNRWYVMERVVLMCGPKLDDVAADRIALDIQAADAEDDFRRCAQVINWPIANYHPTIAAVLQQP